MIETKEGRIALGLCLVFLDKLLLADTSIPVASFEWQSSSSSHIVATPTNMIIDAQAIEHLDILPQPAATNKVNSIDGSLFSYLSRGSRTPFGKRMLKRWTVNPLYDAVQIQRRLDAVEELSVNTALRKKIQRRLSGLKDVERVLTRIYTYSVKQKVKAFYIDAQALNRLDEFYELLNTMRELLQIIKDIFGREGHKAKSIRLRQLVGLRSVVSQNQGERNVDMHSQSEDDHEDEQ